MKLEDSLVAVLNVFPICSLQRLKAALEEGRVIRHKYAGPLRDYGCLFWQLDHAITHRSDRRSYFSDIALVNASERIVRAWDQGILREEDVLAVLREVIAERTEINQAEEQTIATVDEKIRAADQPCIYGNPKTTGRNLFVQMLSDTLGIGYRIGK